MSVEDEVRRLRVLIDQLSVVFLLALVAFFLAQCATCTAIERASNKLFDIKLELHEANSSLRRSAP